jgi:hypothetical protein
LFRLTSYFSRRPESDVIVKFMMAGATFLNLPVEIRYKVFDALFSGDEDITVGTVILNQARYDNASNVVVSEGMPADTFAEVEMVLGSAKGSISLVDLNEGSSIPTNHRLVVSSCVDKALLDVTRSTEPRPWWQPSGLVLMAFTCRSLQAEVNQYLRGANFRPETTLRVAYPLGLLVLHAALPTLLWKVPRIVVAGHYDPWVTESDGQDSQGNMEEALEGLTVEDGLETLVWHTDQDEDGDESGDDGDQEGDDDDNSLETGTSQGGEEYDEQDEVPEGRAEGIARPFLVEDDGPLQVFPRAVYDRASRVVEELARRLISTAPVLERNDASESKKKEKEKNYPLELRIYIPAGPQSHALAWAYPSPCTAALRGPAICVDASKCPDQTGFGLFSDDGNEAGGITCRGIECTGRTWIVRVERGERRRSDDPIPATMRGLPPFDEHEHARIVVEGVGALKRDTTAHIEGRGLTRRVAMVAGDQAERMWRAAARDDSIRPRIPFTAAMDAAAEAAESTQPAVRRAVRDNATDPFFIMFEEEGDIVCEAFEAVRRRMAALIRERRE